MKEQRGKEERRGGKEKTRGWEGKRKEGRHVYHPLKKKKKTPLVLAAIVSRA